MKKWPGFDDVQNWIGMLDRHSLFWFCLVISKKKKLMDIISLIYIEHLFPLDQGYIIILGTKERRFSGRRLISNQRMPIVTGAVLEIFRG